MKITKRITALFLAATLSFAIVGCSNSENDSSTNSGTETSQESNSTYKLQHGELLDETVTGDTLVIKAKIEPSYKNSATINQNGFNVEDIIKNQGGDSFNEIQYWAVADMESGSEDKVISFTLNKDLIQSVKDGNTPGNQIVDNAQDVWILPSLQN